MSEGVEIFCELISVQNIIEMDLFELTIDSGYCSVQICENERKLRNELIWHVSKCAGKTWLQMLCYCLCVCVGVEMDWSGWERCRF